MKIFIKKGILGKKVLQGIREEEFQLII